MHGAVRGSNPFGGEIFRTCPDRPPGAQPASYAMGNRDFPGGKAAPGRGVHHPLTSKAEVEGTVKLYICSPVLDVRGLF
jgi:hypothetical protein